MVTKVLHSRDAHIPFGFINHLTRVHKNFTCKLKCQQWNYFRWLFHISVFFFFFNCLKTKQRTYKLQCECICVCFVCISRRSFIKIYQMESLQRMIISCTFSRSKKKISVTVKTVTVLYCNTLCCHRFVLKALSHSLRYNEMALRLMHRGEICVRLFNIKYAIK